MAYNVKYRPPQGTDIDVTDTPATYSASTDIDVSLSIEVEIDDIDMSSNFYYAALGTHSKFTGKAIVNYAPNDKLKKVSWSYTFCPESGGQSETVQVKIFQFASKLNRNNYCNKFNVLSDLVPEHDSPAGGTVVSTWNFTLTNTSPKSRDTGPSLQTVALNSKDSSIQRSNPTPIIKRFQKDNTGIHSMTMGFSGTCIAYVWGAGGGAGGAITGSTGGQGSAGLFNSTSFNFVSGDIIEVYVGEGGKGGISNQKKAKGGTGGRSKINFEDSNAFNGGQGSAAGPDSDAGGGGGGGGATVIVKNNDIVLAAGGGGGGGGVGAKSFEIQYDETTDVTTYVTSTITEEQPSYYVEEEIPEKVKVNSIILDLTVSGTYSAVGESTIEDYTSFYAGSTPPVTPQKGGIIEVVSTNYNVTNKAGSAYVKVNGLKYNATRGHLFMVLNPETFAVEINQQYDTYGAESSTTLTNALNSVATGKIVVLCVFDAMTLDSNMRTSLRSSFGSTEEFTVDKGTNPWYPRTSYIFIGKKSTPSFTPIEKYSYGYADTWKKNPNQSEYSAFTNQYGVCLGKGTSLNATGTYWFVAEITIPTTKQYTIKYNSDNKGEIVWQSTSYKFGGKWAQDPVTAGQVQTHTITTGKHVIRGSYYNSSGPGTIAIELTATDNNQVIWSTLDIVGVIIGQDQNSIEATYEDPKINAITSSVIKTAMVAPPPDGTKKVAVFGYNSVGSGSKTRSLQTINKRILTTGEAGAGDYIENLVYYVNRGTEADWGQTPDKTERLKLQYSFNELTWVDLDIVEPEKVTANTWTLRTVVVPADIKIPTGVYLRFIQITSSSSGAAPKLDTWAFTSLYNGLPNSQPATITIKKPTKRLVTPEPIVENVITPVITPTTVTKTKTEARTDTVVDGVDAKSSNNVTGVFGSLYYGQNGETKYGNGGGAGGGGGGYPGGTGGASPRNEPNSFAGKTGGNYPAQTGSEGFYLVKDLYVPNETPAWSKFMKDNAVWPTSSATKGKFTAYRTFEAPISGEYQFKFSAADSGSLYIDNVKVANGSFYDTDPEVFTIYLQKGVRVLKLEGIKGDTTTTVSGAGGWALEISDISGGKLWNLRDYLKVENINVNGGGNAYYRDNAGQGGKPNGGNGKDGLAVLIFEPFVSNYSFPSAVKVNGNWKQVTDAFVKVDGQWRQITNTYVKINGQWKETKSTASNEIIVSSTAEGYGYTFRDYGT